MCKKVVISISAFFICLMAMTLALGTDMTGQTLLQDGFVLRGIDGKVLGSDSKDEWFFEFDSPITNGITDGKALVKAGTKLELLPSATLEKITADVKNRSAAGYRLWGRITKYRSKNFIFPTYFLPLSKISKPVAQAPQTPQKPQPQEGRREPAINEPNDILAIPQQILEKLKTEQTRLVDTGQRITDSNSPEQIAKEKLNAKRYTPSADFILADRTGFISLSVMRDADSAKSNTQYDFILDALGRNLQQVSLQLLPSEVLELTELRQSAEPNPIRFKIAGIITEYKGKQYLLLQKATPAYSHGNFGK